MTGCPNAYEQFTTSWLDESRLFAVRKVSDVLPVPRRVRCLMRMLRFMTVHDQLKGNRLLYIFVALAIDQEEVSDP